MTETPSESAYGPGVEAAEQLEAAYRLAERRMFHTDECEGAKKGWFFEGRCDCESKDKLVAIATAARQDQAAELERVKADIEWEQGAHREMSAVAADRTREILRLERQLTEARAALAGYMREHDDEWEQETKADGPCPCDQCRAARATLQPETADGVDSPT